MSVRRRLVKKHPAKKMQPSAAAVPAMKYRTDRCNVRTELPERRLLKENGSAAHIRQNGSASCNGATNVMH